MIQDVLKKTYAEGIKYKDPENVRVIYAPSSSGKTYWCKEKPLITNNPIKLWSDEELVFADIDDIVFRSLGWPKSLSSKWEKGKTTAQDESELFNFAAYTAMLTYVRLQPLKLCVLSGMQPFTSPGLIAVAVVKPDSWYLERGMSQYVERLSSQKKEKVDVSVTAETYAKSRLEGALRQKRRYMDLNIPVYDSFDEASHMVSKKR